MLNGLNPEQQEAVETLSGPLLVLAGAGTGKTFCVAAIVRRLIDAGCKIGVCAPTGKAAIRATESMAAAGLELTARTIHSMLRPTGTEGGEFIFEHGEDLPLPYDCLVVDEASMIDLPLMRSLLRARRRGTPLLLVGDLAQLPPVGYGAPLRDIVASGLVPYAFLSEIHRNAGAIAQGCKDIRLGNMPSVHGKGENLILRETNQQLADAVTVGRQLADRGLDPIWDYQVIVALNENGDLSRKKVNDILQAEFSPGSGKKGYPFRDGDKVMCLQNGSYQTVDKKEVYGANGSVGRVVDMSDGFTIIRMNGNDLKISNKVKDGWTLAYAISCHKSQGSQYPYVATLLDPAARRVTSREWIYTAISRAETKSICLGPMSLMRSMVRRKTIDGRKTFMSEIIREACDEFATVLYLCKNLSGGSLDD